MSFLKDHRYLSNIESEFTASVASGTGSIVFDSISKQQKTRDAIVAGFSPQTFERNQPWPLPLLFLLLLLLGGGFSRSFTFCSSFGGRLLLFPFWPNAVICANRVMERITAINTTINTRFTSFITTCRLRVPCDFTLKREAGSLRCPYFCNPGARQHPLDAQNLSIVY